MSDNSRDAFVPIKDESGRLTGLMDRTMADYLVSQAPDPNQQSIDQLLEGITRVRVVPVENCFLGAEPRTLLETSDRATLASFRGCFTIVEDPQTFGHCMCLGDPHLELYAGDKLAAIIGYHHGFSIRWNAWKHDALLKEPHRLLNWLSDHGVGGPRLEIEETSRLYEESQRHREQWLEAMPDCFRPFQERMDDDLNSELHQLLLAALRATIPSPKQQALSLFGWFGSGAGPWSGYPSYEGVPKELLLDYSTSSLVEALTSSTPTETQWCGAARYFGGWDFWKRKQGDRALLPTALNQRLLAAARATNIADNFERAVGAFKE